MAENSVFQTMLYESDSQGLHHTHTYVVSHFHESKNSIIARCLKRVYTFERNCVILYDKQ